MGLDGHFVGLEEPWIGFGFTNEHVKACPFDFPTVKGLDKGSLIDNSTTSGLYGTSISEQEKEG